MKKKKEREELQQPFKPLLVVSLCAQWDHQIIDCYSHLFSSCLHPLFVFIPTSELDLPQQGATVSSAPDKTGIHSDSDFALQLTSHQSRSKLVKVIRSGITTTNSLRLLHPTFSRLLLRPPATKTNNHVGIYRL